MSLHKITTVFEIKEISSIATIIDLSLLIEREGRERVVERRRAI